MTRFCHTTINFAVMHNAGIPNNDVLGCDPRLRDLTTTSSQGQETGLREGIGVLIAIVSSALGGTAAAVTRYLVSDADALTLAILRWAIGFLCVLPVALLLRSSEGRRV